jgi:predicted PurR-regulated permease PerM
VALVDDPRAGLIVVVVIVLYQQVENYLFLPRITARTLELHPALAFGAVIAGAALLGAVGALLAIPLAACLQAFATMYWPSHELVDSPLVTEPATPPKRRPSRRARVR